MNTYSSCQFATKQNAAGEQMQLLPLPENKYDILERIKKGAYKVGLKITLFYIS